MQKQPEKKHVVIYLVSLIHWIGTGVTLGLINSFFNPPVLVIVGLLILAFLFLPPIFRVVEGEVSDDE
jgi:hypothetical protein